MWCPCIWCVEHVLIWTQWPFKPAKFCSLCSSERATRACPWILPARLAALPQSSLGSGIVHRTWAKAQWSQWMVFYWSKPLNWSSTGEGNWAEFLLSTHQNNIWISLCCLFYFLLSFFWTLNYLVQTDFLSIYLLVLLNAVTSWGRGEEGDK